MATHDPRTLGDQPAVPFSQITESYQQAHAQHRGLTKREFFAGLALCGYVARGYLHDPEDAAKTVIDHADALIATLAGGAK
ncbi:MAG TPA: hypothetical protein VIT62_14530 [Lysobacter sp.]